jgi:hypothetical protein
VLVAVRFIESLREVKTKWNARPDAAQRGFRTREKTFSPALVAFRRIRSRFGWSSARSSPGPRCPNRWKRSGTVSDTQRFKGYGDGNRFAD